MIFRVLDASVNRVCEGLRVCEELLRFAGIAEGYEQLKKIRHSLRKMVSPYKSQMLTARDSETDIGREGKSSKDEYVREDIEGIFNANIKRAQEGMRVVEEVLKTFSRKIAKKAEQLRFALYTVERSYSARIGIHKRLLASNLYVITSPGFRNDVVSVVSEIAGIADVVQLRLKNVKDVEFLRIAEKVKKALEGSQTVFIVNDRADIASTVGADGVHIGVDDLPIEAVRRIFTGAVGMTVHNRRELRDSLKAGADYLGVGSFYKSSKETAPVGGLKLAKMMKNVKTPWFAIGGIDETRLEELVNAGVRRICVMRAVLDSNDAKTTAISLRRRLLRLLNRLDKK
jgi:thiamine-phosphate pyrophosphorylase